MEFENKRICRTLSTRLTWILLALPTTTKGAQRRGSASPSNFAASIMARVPLGACGTHLPHKQLFG